MFMRALDMRLGIFGRSLVLLCVLSYDYILVSFLEPRLCYGDALILIWRSQALFGRLNIIWVEDFYGHFHPEPPLERILCVGSSGIASSALI